MNEEREDLKLSSSALIGHVKSRSKYWVPLWEFIPMDDEEKEAHVQKRNAIKENIKKLEQESKDRIKEKELKEKLMREKELSEKKIIQVQSAMMNQSQHHQDLVRELLILLKQDTIITRSTEKIK